MVHTRLYFSSFSTKHGLRIGPQLLVGGELEGKKEFRATVISKPKGPGIHYQCSESEEQQINTIPSGFQEGSEPLKTVQCLDAWNSILLLQRERPRYPENSKHAALFLPLKYGGSIPQDCSSAAQTGKGFASPGGKKTPSIN